MWQYALAQRVDDADDIWVQIEKANLVDLDWALANMEAKSKKKGWVYEAEATGKKEDVCRLILCDRTLVILTL